MGDWLITEGVPRLNAFIAGLTGDKSLSASFTATQKKSEEFGRKVRGVIDTFIEYKDVVIAAAAVTATVFVVSKIAAGVTATIALIRSLIMAYNALKASAVTAAIATAFALNPIAGAAASAGIFAALGLAAKKLSDMDNADLPTAPTYNDRVVAEIAGRSAVGATAATSITSTPSVSIGAPSTGGGGSSAVAKAAEATVAAAKSVEKAAETIVDMRPQLPASVAEWRARESGDVINMPSAVSGNFDPARFRAREEGITIVVQAPSAIDEEGFSRAVVDALNKTQSRTGGGGGQLIGLAQAL